MSARHAWAAQYTPPHLESCCTSAPPPMGARHSSNHCNALMLKKLPRCRTAARARGTEVRVSRFLQQQRHEYALLPLSASGRGPPSLPIKEKAIEPFWIHWMCASVNNFFGP